MDRRVRYEVLQTEDDPDVEEPAQHVVVAMVAPPVADTPVSPETTVTITEEGATGGQETEPTPAAPEPVASEEAKFFEPPSYSVATSLPTYEEAEQSKAEEAAASREQEQEQDQDQEQQYGMFAWNNNQQLELGTDYLFLCTFAVAFLFNWIGLMAAICLSRTIAGRLGAVAGFGLSMVKWVAIVKHTNLGNGVAGDSWLWWLLILLGFLIFFRGCTQYIRIKYQWQTLTQYVRGRAYLYF